MQSVTTPENRVPISHIYKTIALVLVIAAIVIAGWLLLGNSLDSGDDNNANPPVQGHTKSAPDKVKQSDDSNSDADPSSNGGSSNSMFNQ